MSGKLLTVRDEIVLARLKDLGEKGNTLGFPVPERRSVPLVSFSGKRLLICEVKRRSPSKGDIASTLDAVEQAGRYAGQGAECISVLTEERFFGGTLPDLMEIKKTYPHLAVLRKDFLMEPGDIDVSYRAGADAVLLIAGILSAARLEELYRRAVALGMEALVEIHSEEDIRKAAEIRPGFTGINSRNLETFRIDPVLPLKIRSRIRWDTTFIYESGITSEEEARFASSAGFSGILAGESVVRRPELIPELFRGLESGSGTDPDRFFWNSLYNRRMSGRPLVKICGITNPADLKLADSFGADILGFVLVPSPRKAELEFLRHAGRTEALKVAVVAAETAERSPAAGPETVRSGIAERLTDASTLDALGDLIGNGYIDAVQFHGLESPSLCYRTAFPYYKAVGVDDETDIEHSFPFRCPRVLFDAKLQNATGGTGVRMPEFLARKAAERRPLWLAGGLGPADIAHVLESLSPELIDASSRLESSPGRKDPEALAVFFREIERIMRHRQEKEDDREML